MLNSDDQCRYEDTYECTYAYLCTRLFKDKTNALRAKTCFSTKENERNDCVCKYVFLVCAYLLP